MRDERREKREEMREERERRQEREREVRLPGGYAYIWTYREREVRLPGGAPVTYLLKIACCSPIAPNCS
jgi:hypothetical protein